ncbi:MAG: hypothetical protein KIT79_02185 [Deltaproteobacteria bacterium]|nr:hypothetical protein [Deltaproteobacteria bacterium]
MNYDPKAVELGPGGRHLIDCRNLRRVVVRLWGEGETKDEWNSGEVSLLASAVDPRQVSSGFAVSPDPEGALASADWPWEPCELPSGEVVFDGTTDGGRVSVDIAEDDLPPFLLLEVRPDTLEAGHKIHGTVWSYPRR